METQKLQNQQLNDLLATAADTEFGRKYNFRNTADYPRFCQEIPISFYSDIRPAIEKLKKGASDLIWPGKITDFAVSAGTSGAGKHLPLTSRRLESDRRYMKKLAWCYLRQRPNIFKLMGKHISLPGTLEVKADKEEKYQVGEISAFSARRAPWWLSPFQLVSTEELIQLSFSKKIERVLDQSINRDIRVISSAPSWILTIFQRILQQTGADSIAEIWPNLSLLVCGGVKLANYQSHLEKLIGEPDVDFIETYGASEGYFSFTDDLQREDMKLVVDNGIFYEFIPNPLPDEESLSIQETVPLWEVQEDVPYALVVTTNAGLWRYALNDIVIFSQTDPPRIKVKGRVGEMLDEYGEALYAFEAEKALKEASESIGLETGIFTISSTLKGERELPRHFWFVHIADPVHRDTLDRLAQRLDTLLQQKNRHYAIRRESGALGIPQVKSITQKQINNWLEKHGKDKAQGKLPSILQNEQGVEFFL